MEALYEFKTENMDGQLFEVVVAVEFELDSNYGADADGNRGSAVMFGRPEVIEAWRLDETGEVSVMDNEEVVEWLLRVFDEKHIYKALEEIS